ncbi:MAG: hypothetical protein P1U49_00130 [Minwuia sp.]|nr:hypothetical protein [Minwuia sp.]
MIFRKSHLSALLLAGCLLSGTALAAEEPSMIQEIDPSVVKEVSDLVVANIQVGDCGGTQCEPANAIEKIDGMLPRDMTEQVISRGAGSAFAEFCDLDWGNQSYLPLMDRERNSGCWSERQVAAISVTHGIAMGLYRNTLKTEIGQCTAAVKTAVEQYLLSLRNFTKRGDCPRW